MILGIFVRLNAIWESIFYLIYHKSIFELILSGVLFALGFICISLSLIFIFRAKKVAANYQSRLQPAGIVLFEENDEPNVAKRHSRMGIASIIIGGGLPLLVTALIVISWASYEIADSLIFYKISDETGTKFLHTLSDGAIKLLFVVGFRAPLLHLMGLILGLFGAFSKGTKKKFSIAGIVLNLILGLIGVVLVLFLSVLLRPIYH